MQPVLLTVNGTGTSAVVVMDYAQNPFQVGIGVNAVGIASTAWRIEHTFVNLNPATATAGENNATTTVWFLNAAIATSSNTTAVATAVAMDLNYVLPVRGIRLSVVTAAATSIVIANIIQASNAP